MSRLLYEVINELRVVPRGKPRPVEITTSSEIRGLVEAGHVDYPVSREDIARVLRIAEAWVLRYQLHKKYEFMDNVNAAMDFIWSYGEKMRCLPDLVRIKDFYPLFNVGKTGRRVAAAGFNARLVLDVMHKRSPGMAESEADRLWQVASEWVRQSVYPYLVAVSYIETFIAHLRQQEKSDYTKDLMDLRYGTLLETHALMSRLTEIDRMHQRGMTSPALELVTGSLPEMLLLVPDQPALDPCLNETLAKELEGDRARHWDSNAALAALLSAVRLALVGRIGVIPTVGRPKNTVSMVREELHFRLFPHLCAGLATYCFAKLVLQAEERSQSEKFYPNDPKKSRTFSDLGEEPKGDRGQYTHDWSGNPLALDEYLKAHGLEGNHVLSCKMNLVTPPRVVPCRQMIACAVRAAPRQEGYNPRHLHRYCVDQSIFHAPKGGQPGGTVLIDASGSMSWDVDEIEALAASCPNITLACYNGSHNVGWLTILSEGGKRVDDQQLKYAFTRAGGNVVDYPALQWLATKRGPLIWVSDGYVSGVSDTPSTQLANMCDAWVRDHNIFHVLTITDAVSILTRRGVGDVILQHCPHGTGTFKGYGGATEVLAAIKNRGSWVI